MQNTDRTEAETDTSDPWQRAYYKLLEDSERIEKLQGQCSKLIVENQKLECAIIQVLAITDDATIRAILNTALSRIDPKNKQIHEKTD